MTRDLIRKAMALVAAMPDAQTIVQGVKGRAKGGPVKGGRLLQDKYPTRYMPNVGRQVMAKGGDARELSGHGLHGEAAAGAFGGAGDGHPAGAEKDGTKSKVAHPARSVHGAHILADEAGEPIFEEERRQ